MKVYERTAANIENFQFLLFRVMLLQLFIDVFTAGESNIQDAHIKSHLVLNFAPHGKVDIVLQFNFA